MSMGVSEFISANTRYCAVFGHPVKHSASPAMQNAGLCALGLPWRYLAFDVAPGELATAIAGAKAMRFIGLNLTVPHKVAAVGMMDELDETARTLGAVNTVRFEARDESGVWRPLGQFDEVRGLEVRSVGFNTDAEAISRVIKSDLGVKLEGAVALVLGAGGAGRTAALQLAAERVGELWLVNRTVAKAEALAAEIRQRWLGVKVQVGYPSCAVDVIINATSLGLGRDDPLPFDPKVFDMKRAKSVFDMVYRPAETSFLRVGKAAGCRCTNGLGMLLYQGVSALELWSGLRAPIDQMKRALEIEVYGK
ncbi:MAG: shikimate dehydrogenase [Verrucomicrobiota bacterium]|nr:shikimate dehydrogenase [Verrucomicrobiota bacterium]